MEDLEKQVIGEVKKGIGEAIHKRLTEYGSPLNKLVDLVVAGHDTAIKQIMSDAITSAVMDEDFKKQIREQVRHKLARELVNSFGDGAFKKASDQMKSDPTIRARCVMAIEAIVNENLKPTN